VTAIDFQMCCWYQISSKFDDFSSR